MNKDFIPYSEALELKQLGFDEVCIYHYKKNNEGEHSSHPTFEMLTPFGKNHNILESRVSAPSYSQAFRFFREKYDLDYSLLPESSSGHRLSTRTFNIVIYKYYMNMNVQSEIVRIDGKIVRYNKREEAELACLKKLIEIVNEQQ
jgi:hypothetical protein